MRTHKSLWLALMVMASSLVLASCGSSDDAKPDAEKEQHAEEKVKSKIKAPTPICPQVAVVRGLDLARDYGNEIPADNQLVAAAKMLKIEGDCEYNDKGIDVTFKVDMAAKRGPRLGGNHVSFPIFVAVLDPADTVLNKNQMTVDINLPSDAKEDTHAEALHVFIPLAKDSQTSGPQYKVLAGFQLTPEQAEAAKASLKP